MTQVEILVEARRRAALRAWKQPWRQEKILLGRVDNQRSVLRCLREIEREITFAKMHDMRPLKPEEDEPCFAELIQRAKARAEELAGTLDGQLIGDLVAAYEHADNMADMIYWNASDNLELPHDA